MPTIIERCFEKWVYLCEFYTSSIMAPNSSDLSAAYDDGQDVTIPRSPSGLVVSERSEWHR